MRKRWLFVPLAVVVLMFGVAGGAALADGDETNGDSPLNSLVARVASILGLEEAVVQDAFDQAATELRDEALQNRLDSLVEGGQLTQEQADEQLEWYQSRPESIDPGIRGIPGHGGKGGQMCGGGMRGGRGHFGGGFFYGGPTAPAPEVSGDTA